jgi:uroporphyrinogen decarboxylase
MSLSPPRPPDFNRLRQALLRQEPESLPLIELLVDREMMEAVLGERIPRAAPGDTAARHKELDQVIRFWHTTGYDYITVQAGVTLPRRKLESDDTAPLKHEQRQWDDENTGPIMSWQDFERYPWPRPESVDWSAVEYIAAHLPEGMRMIFLGPGGQFENLAELMGLTPLALAVHDDPALVQAVADKVGALLASLFATAAELPEIGALWLGDDLGYKTSTVLSPRHLRRFVFPYQKTLAEIAHARGLPFLLHSCGNLERIMPELIETVGIAARHSFEDVILPVSEAKLRWGGRVALLGGIDMDFLCRASEEEVRVYTRGVLAACAPGGGYALGTGNTVANYIPPRNYLAMVDEGLRWRG